MVHHQVADGGQYFKIWRINANILNICSYYHHNKACYANERVALGVLFIMVMKPGKTRWVRCITSTG